MDRPPLCSLLCVLGLHCAGSPVKARRSVRDFSRAGAKTTSAVPGVIDDSVYFESFGWSAAHDDSLLPSQSYQHCNNTRSRSTPEASWRRWSRRVDGSPWLHDDRGGGVVVEKAVGLGCGSALRAAFGSRRVASANKQQILHMAHVERREEKAWDLWRGAPSPSYRFNAVRGCCGSSTPAISFAFLGTPTKFGIMRNEGSDTGICIARIRAW